jgi:hypothetical protein
MKENSMKKEYDFSKGTRGKFYRAGVKLDMPVYLDKDNFDFIEKIAKKKKMDVSETVNEILRVDKELVKAIL